MPQLVGLTQEAAEAKIVELGFTVGTISQEHSTSIPAGMVMSTNPTSQTEASLKSPINLVISDGLVSIPDVTGKAIGEATGLLSALQLTVITQSDSSCTGSLVSAQTLVGDQPQKSSVTITYCGGI